MNTATRRHWLFTLGAGALLAGCGFQLRQAPRFAFEAIRIDGGNGAPVTGELRRVLALNGLKVFSAATPTNAEGDLAPQVVLTVLTDQRERVVVGQTAAGQVRELQLRTRFTFRVRSASGRDLIGDTELLLERDLSFNETIVLSKAAEEERLYRDMVTDIADQVLRRLAAVKAI